MTRMIFLVMFLAGMALTIVGCTNTVRGMGKDFNSTHMQNYNRKTASEF